MMKITGLASCRKYASLAAKHNLMVTVNSDAHFAADLGRREMAFRVLEEDSRWKKMSECSLTGGRESKHFKNGRR